MAITITYTQQGDYLLPDLKLPEQPKVEIGVFGQRHKRYLKEHHRLIYFNLLTSCKLAAACPSAFRKRKHNRTAQSGESNGMDA